VLLSERGDLELGLVQLRAQVLIGGCGRLGRVALRALADVLVVSLLDLEQKTPKVLVPLDDLVEGLREGLHLLAFVVRCLFQPRRQLLLQVYGVRCKVPLVLLLLLALARR